jgi:hypothetical protein
MLAKPGFEFAVKPKKDLRLVRVNSNPLADDLGDYLHNKMRVPHGSVIYKVYTDRSLRQAEAFENLNWWETSKGGFLPARKIKVCARRNGETVVAFIIPL